MNFNTKFLRMPLNQTVLFLVSMAVAAVTAQIVFSTNLETRLLAIFIHFLATLGVGTLLYGILQSATGKKKNYANTLVACLILFLVIAPPTTLQEVGLVALATILTMLIKYFGTIHGKPLVNPAAGGMLLSVAVAALVLPNSYFALDWWGTSFWKLFQIDSVQIRLSLVLILAWIVLGLGKWRRSAALLAFVVTALTCQIFMAFLAENVETQLGFLLYVFSDSTIYFFAAVMLIEPKTSPTSSQQQIIFGGIIGVIFSVLNYHYILGIPQLFSFFYNSYYLTALIVGNLLFFLWLQWTALQKAKSVSDTTSKSEKKLHIAKS